MAQHTISTKSHTWIDLILTEDNDTILDYKNEWLPSFGRHAIIDVTLKIFAPEPVSDSFSYMKYQNISPNTLNELLQLKPIWKVFYII